MNGPARPLALAAAFVMAVAAPPAAAGVRPAFGGTIRVGVPTAPRAAPGAAAAAADALVERATRAPLLELDGSGALAPGALAEVPLPEAGGRAFRLRVRPGLTDGAGRPLGAPDVAARLAAVLAAPAPGVAGPDAWAALPILGADAVLEGRAPVLAGIQVLSAAELLVTLAFPLPEFPWLLAAPPLALDGAGPFVPGPRRPGGAAVLLRNDRHHAGRPYADALEISAVDPRAAPRLLDQGGLDLVLRPDAAGGRPGPALPPLLVTVAVVNGARLGAGAGPVRAALAALDRAELARRFVRGPAVPLATIVPPSILGGPAAPPAPAPAAAGAGAAPPRLALLASSAAPDAATLADRVQVKLFDSGLRAAVQLAGDAAFRARLAAGDYDVALLAVQVAALRPALAAGQVAFAARGAAAARRTMATLAGLEGDAAAAAAVQAGLDLDLVPLVASGLRAAAGPALQGLAPRADGTFDPGALWRLGGGTAR